MMLDLNMSHGIMPSFGSFLLFGLTLAIKLKKLEFKSLKKYYYFFDIKSDVRFEYALSNSF